MNIAFKYIVKIFPITNNPTFVPEPLKICYFCSDISENNLREAMAFILSHNDGSMQVVAVLCPDYAKGVNIGFANNPLNPSDILKV